MSRLLDFLHRHEPRGAALAHIKSGLGAIVALSLVGALATLTGLPLLLAPLGATSVLLFGQPESALAQPANVVGGYLVAALLSALMVILFPPAWWIATIAVGLVVGVTLILRVTHPPAGAVPLVAVSSHLPPEILFIAVLAGAAGLVVVAVLHHSLPPRVTYPRRVARDRS